MPSVDEIGQKDRSIVIEGVLTYTNHHSHSGQQQRPIYFCFQRSGCKWLLKSGPGERRLGYTETGFDGVDKYSFTYWNNEALETERKKPGLAYFVTGEVKAVPVPDWDLGWSRHIWFALMPRNCEQVRSISGCDLVAGQRVITNCNRTLIVSLHEDGAFVTNAVVWSEGYDLTEDGRAVAFAPPFNKGFTNLIFSSTVIHWSEAGVEAPNSFKYDVFVPIGDKLAPVWSLFGMVTNVQIRERFNPVPEITDRTYVIDYRAVKFGHAEPISYIATNKWVQPDDPYFQELLKASKEALAASRRGKWVRWCVLGFTVVGFLVVFGRLAMSMRKKTNCDSTSTLRSQNQ
ncbi:MAG: hypothetical protein RMH97_06565, partial [Verrucomicrobiales bacterium]|nr:hypothetical protein [Verrucomicrobiales bacterium]